MPNIAFINSKYIEFKNAKVHIEDRGFQFSDSVYDVLKVINKKLIDCNDVVKCYDIIKSFDNKF